MNTQTCEFVIHPGSRWIDPEPAELCDEPAIEGTEFCPDHKDD